MIGRWGAKVGAGCTWYDYKRWLLPRGMYDRQVGSRVRVVWCMINPRINPKVLGSRGVVRDWGGLIFIVAVNFKPPTPAPPPPPCMQPTAFRAPEPCFRLHVSQVDVGGGQPCISETADRRELLANLLRRVYCGSLLRIVNMHA